MTIWRLVLVAAIAAVFCQPLISATQSQGVCDALNSAHDHQEVVIHAAMASTRHETFLYEGKGGDPCPGWPRHFFTGPSAISIVISSFAGVKVPEKVHRQSLEFAVRLRELSRGNTSVRRIVTAQGVMIMPRWRLIFRDFRGEYCCWGVGIRGDYAGLLVLTSAPIEDH
jgi:hypothetical protein